LLNLSVYHSVPLFFGARGTMSAVAMGMPVLPPPAAQQPGAPGQRTIAEIQANLQVAVWIYCSY
jgi:hypothetical protein